MSKARKLLVIGLSAIFFYAAVAADKKHTIFAVHSENAKYVLYSAQGKAGSFASDHLLWAKIKATGKVRLAVPHELFGPRAGVWSAVLSRKNPDMAYVVADSELPSSRGFQQDLRGRPGPPNSETAPLPRTAVGRHHHSRLDCYFG